MIKGHMKYGISYLPQNCAAYKDGYRLGAYQQNLHTGETHVVDFFKTKRDATAFVKENREYGKEQQ